LSQQFSAKLLEKNIYAIGFFFPVVPQEKARIRTQISAAHTTQHLDQAIEAFIAVGRDHGVCQ
jgi:glycine C-acetyltransferase